MHGHIRERKEIPNDIWHSNFAIYIHIVDKQHRCLFWVTNKGCSANVWEALGDGFCLAYLLYLYVPSDPFSFLSSYVEFELYLGFIVFLLLYIVCIWFFFGCYGWRACLVDDYYWFLSCWSCKFNSFPLWVL